MNLAKDLISRASLIIAAAIQLIFGFVLRAYASYFGLTMFKLFELFGLLHFVELILLMFELFMDLLHDLFVQLQLHHLFMMVHD